METNLVFRTINRINSVLFLVLLMAAVAGSLFVFLEIALNDRRTVVEIESPDKEGEREAIELADVKRVAGHEQQYVHVYTKRDGVLKSGGYSRTLRNLLFLRGGSTAPQWLLPNNSSVILAMQELRTYREKDSVTDFFYFEVVSQDKNGDGKISEADGISIGISSPFGTNYHVIQEDLSKVVDYEYFPETKTLGVLGQVGNELRYRTYDLQSSKQLSDDFIIKLN